MHDLPHRYVAAAKTQAEGDVVLDSEGLPPLATAPPPQFGGPGGRWSPETLLMAAVADCFVLTFRAIARGSKLEWTALTCEVEGTLDKADGTTRFTELAICASLRVPASTDRDRAARVLRRAEQACLITNSLKTTTRLDALIEEV